jgi:hypothetical protein
MCLPPVGESDRTQTARRGLVGSACRLLPLATGIDATLMAVVRECFDDGSAMSASRAECVCRTTLSAARLAADGENRGAMLLPWPRHRQMLLPVRQRG